VLGSRSPTLMDMGGILLMSRSYTAIMTVAGARRYLVAAGAR